jgi:flavin reductase (DIM6/NTAB) family NADH-FMN oxidoreductase RutF
MTIDPKQIPHPKLHGYMQSAVVPRPIAFASTVDGDGNVNLSPFSFFNVFSTNPPILIFSPSRRGRDNTTKHTYQNAKEVPEVVINVVNYAMVEQASLASCEFPKGVNEFVKAGFTEVKSERVKPPRVAEAPVSFECKVNQVIELGATGGAGNLILCEVLLIHVKEEVLDSEGRIDPFKLDAVARMGQDYYCRANGDNIFVVPKPNDKLGIGFDRLPESVRNSEILSMNDLARLANVENLPDAEEALLSDPEWAHHKTVEQLHVFAKQLLKEGKVNEAWRALLAFDKK